MRLTAESRCHSLAEVSYRETVATYIDIGCNLPFKVACSLQLNVTRIANIGHKVNPAVIGVLMIIVQLHKVDIEFIGEQLLHGWHLGVLTNTTCKAHECGLSKEYELGQRVACVSAWVEIYLAMHGVLAWKV